MEIRDYGVMIHAVGRGGGGGGGWWAGEIISLWVPFIHNDKEGVCVCVRAPPLRRTSICARFYLCLPPDHTMETQAPCALSLKGL